MPIGLRLLLRDVIWSQAFRNHAERLAAAARPAVDNVVVVDRVDSTQASVLRLVDQAEADELTLPTTLVVAAEQDRGLGRVGRQWHSPAGGLYLTWLACGLDTEALAALPMVAAAAVWTAVTRLGVPDAAIKWPNDILVAGRKLAGILIHARHGAATWAAVGVGVNLERPPRLAADQGPPAVALSELLDGGTGATWAEAVVGTVAEQLQVGARAPEAAVALWREHLIHRPGDEIRVRTAAGPPVRGRFAGVTDAGHLRLEVDGAERVIATGDVVE